MTKDEQIRVLREALRKIQEEGSFSMGHSVQRGHAWYVSVAEGALAATSSPTEEPRKLWKPDDVVGPYKVIDDGFMQETGPFIHGPGLNPNVDWNDYVQSVGGIAEFANHCYAEGKKAALNAYPGGEERDFTPDEIIKECNRRGWAEPIFSYESNRFPKCRIYAGYIPVAEAWEHILQGDSFRAAFAAADKAEKGEK